MDDNQKKLAVVIVGIVATAGVVAWRSVKALAEVRAAQRGGSEAGDTLVTNVEGHAPEGFHARYIPASMEEPRLPHFELGTIKVRADERHIRASFQPTAFHSAEVAPARAMGANAVWHKQVDTNLPELELGQAETTDVFYLVYLSELPDQWRGPLNGVGCWVNSVEPGSDAEAGGLRADDVLLDVDHQRVDGRSFSGCELVGAMRQAPAGQAVVATVLRGGQTLDLTLVRHGERFGFQFNMIPIFPSGTTQLPR